LSVLYYTSGTVIAGVLRVQMVYRHNWFSMNHQRGSDRVIHNALVWRFWL